MTMLIAGILVVLSAVALGVYFWTHPDWTVDRFAPEVQDMEQPMVAITRAGRLVLGICIAGFSACAVGFFCLWRASSQGRGSAKEAGDP